jgi:hypothetical protein
LKHPFREADVKRAAALLLTLICAIVAIRSNRISLRKSTGSTASASGATPPAAASSAPSSLPTAAPAQTDNSEIARAFSSHARDVRVDGEGTVARVLPDDTQGGRHQRFLVNLPSGQSVLIVHNIDIAPRVENLRVGDDIQFEGEYIWNDKGGLVHWTHHDPAARHKTGWIKYAGRTYQ